MVKSFLKKLLSNMWICWKVLSWWNLGIDSVGSPSGKGEHKTWWTVFNLLNADPLLLVPGPPPRPIISPTVIWKLIFHLPPEWAHCREVWTLESSKPRWEALGSSISRWYDLEEFFHALFSSSVNRANTTWKALLWLGSNSYSDPERGWWSLHRSCF